jgi:hypothetical protein
MGSMEAKMTCSTTKNPKIHRKSMNRKRKAYERKMK